MTRGKQCLQLHTLWQKRFQCMHLHCIVFRIIHAFQLNTNTPFSVAWISIFIPFIANGSETYDNITRGSGWASYYNAFERPTRIYTHFLVLFNWKNHLTYPLLAQIPMSHRILYHFICQDSSRNKIHLQTNTRLQCWQIRENNLWSWKMILLIYTHRCPWALTVLPTSAIKWCG